MESRKFVFRILKICISLMVALLIILFIMRVGEASYAFGYRIYTEEAVAQAPGTDISVTVESGMSDSDIADLLEDRGLIRDRNVFLAQLKISAYSGEIQAGTYTLNTSMTGRELIGAMGSQAAGSQSTESTDSTESTEGAGSTESE